MVGTTTDGWRVTVEGTAIRGATIAPTAEAKARVVAFVSMSKSVNQILKNNVTFIDYTVRNSM